MEPGVAGRPLRVHGLPGNGAVLGGGSSVGGGCGSVEIGSETSGSVETIVRVGDESVRPQAPNTRAMATDAI